MKIRGNPPIGYKIQYLDLFNQSHENMNFFSLEKTYSLNEIKFGGEVVFKKIYLQAKPIFMNYIRKYNLEEEDIKDLYQDCFMIFYRNLMTGKITELKSKVSTYLIGIGKHKVMEFYRFNRKFSQFENSLENQECILFENDFFDEPEFTIKQQILYRVYGNLGRKCREILDSYYYEGLSIKEIKKIAGYKSRNVVKAQKSRCLKSLRKLVN